MIPPKANAAFVATMEYVLDLYKRPHDPARPLVCLDETSKQLVAEARRLVAPFEWHYTPKHGSWLNLAECELAVLSRQGLDRRIPDTATLQTEVNTWRVRRNPGNVKANWHFKAADARVKLDSLYP